MMAPRRFASSVIIATFLSVGCAGSGTKGSQPSWRAAGEGKAPSTTPQRLVFAPTGVAADAYNQPPFVEARKSEVAEAIVRQLITLSADIGKTPPVSDGRLFAAADDLAAVSPDEGTVAYRMIEFALQRHGIIEPSPHLIVMRAARADVDAVLAELGTRLGAILAESDFARVGVGVSPRGEDESVIVLALQSSAITTVPIPRRLAKGKSTPLKGIIAAPFRDPHIYVTREEGDVETLPIQRGADGSFAAQMSCEGHQGRQQVEITASDHTGSTVLANFPMWCGEAPPASITVQIGGDDAGQFADANEAEAKMVEFINRDRRKHGLPPVTGESRLGAVARAHSNDMFVSEFVGHISPNTGSATERVAAGGVKTAVVLENVARAYGLAEAQDGLMNSPGHRANILSRSATHVGVGIVLGKTVAGRPEMFITQVFIAIPKDINRDEAVAAVVAKLKKVRSVTSDPRLAELAQEFANSLAAGVSTKDAAARTSMRLHEKQLPYRGVTTLAATLSDVPSFELDNALADNSISHFGVGVAQGDHPELGEKAISIVVLFGHQ